MIPESAIAKAREILLSAKRPVFFHDDDADGTISFVLCYRFCGEGKSVPVKRSPVVTADFHRYVQEYNADLIVILDKPRVEEEFFAQTKLPVLWIDHHEPQTSHKPYSHAYYLNPRLFDDADNRPTSYWCYQITQKNLWLATVGCIADWHVPDFLEEFRNEYPGLAPPATTIEELYIDTPVGQLIRVVQFNLKGQTADVKKSILTLSRVDDPSEILGQTSARGRFLWKKYHKLALPYETELERAKNTPPMDTLLCYEYDNEEMTFTSELSNELLIRFPDKVILVARKHDGSYKCSLRSKFLEIPPIIDTCLVGLEGYGGGHKHACGLVVAQKDWAVFLDRFREQIKK